MRALDTRTGGKWAAYGYLGMNGKAVQIMRPDDEPIAECRAPLPQVARIDADALELMAQACNMRVAEFVREYRA